MQLQKNTQIIKMSTRSMFKLVLFSKCQNSLVYHVMRAPVSAMKRSQAIAVVFFALSSTTFSNSS